MKKVLLGMLFASLLAACNSSRQQSIWEVDLTRNYPHKELVLQDLFDVEYIRLETDSDYLLSRNTPDEGVLSNELKRISAELADEDNGVLMILKPK